MDRPDLNSDEPPLYRYRFGNVEFDEARAELLVAGLAVELEQRPLQVLACLLRHIDEVVLRDELFDMVWAGRPTVDNVLANAIAKLRKALGPGESGRIVNVPRVGYRICGPVERIVAGRRLRSRLQLAAGQAVPGRAHFRLHAQLGPSNGSEAWLARHDKTGELRVYKFSADGERLALLKREATIFRMLLESLGERDDFVRVIDWNFETAPFYLEDANTAGPTSRAGRRRRRAWLRSRPSSVCACSCRLPTPSPPRTASACCTRTSNRATC